MPLSAAAGTFTTGTGTMQVDVTGLAFQPKAVLLATTGLLAALDYVAGGTT